MLLQQLLRLPVVSEIDVEEKIFYRISKHPIVGNPFVQFEVRVNDLLNHVLDLVIECKPDILTRVHAGDAFASRIGIWTASQKRRFDDLLKVSF
jgi:hypothetical protein